MSEPVTLSEALASRYVQRTRLVEEDMCGMTVNPYVLCDHRCGYCNTGVQGRSEPIYPADQILERFLDEISEVSGELPIAFGGISDAYPAAEIDTGVSRLILEALVQLPNPVAVITKGSAVERDADLLASRPLITVAVSVSCVDEEMARRLEPFAPTPTERLDIVGRLVAAGVDASVSASPWIPGVSDIDAVLAHVGPDVPVTVGPLNIEFQQLVGARFGEFDDQATIDVAYLAEFERIGTPTNLAWVRPPTQAGDSPLGKLAMGQLHRERARDRQGLLPAADGSQAERIHSDG